MEKVTIYGKPFCPYCDMAVQLCERQGYEFEYIDIQARDMSIADLHEIVGKPVRTVPQIFIGDTHVGGHDDLVALDSRGGLVPLLGA